LFGANGNSGITRLCAWRHGYRPRGCCQQYTYSPR
jgi:hypothetical protein